MSSNASSLSRAPSRVKVHLEVKATDPTDLVSVEVHPRPPSGARSVTSRPPSASQQHFLQGNAAMHSNYSSRPPSSAHQAAETSLRLDDLQQNHQHTTTSLQRLQAMDLFQVLHQVQMCFYVAWSRFSDLVFSDRSGFSDLKRQHWHPCTINSDHWI